MDNYTYYKEEIKEILVDGADTVGVYKKTGVPCACRKVACDDCLLFDKHSNCDEIRRAWLTAEHVDKPTLTQDEHTFLSLLKPDSYIARDKDGPLYLYNSDDLQKGSDIWKWRTIEDDQYVLRINHVAEEFMNLEVKLSFIKWEDEQPWKVEDLLKLEVR